jgi:pimeloyl-ACP methyl ester carboxylesterase
MESTLISGRSSSPPLFSTESAVGNAPTVTTHRQRFYETFQWKGHNINYRVEGPTEATPILLIHGFGANVNHYRYQFPDLVEAGYKVYAIDLLGFGGSDKPGDFPYSIEEFSELCADFATAMTSEKKPWVLAGNSIGGLCALATAELLMNTDFPVKACVLFNCAGGMSGFRYEDVPVYIKPILWFVQNIVLGPQFGGRFFENFKTRENVESILKSQGVYRDTTNVDEHLIEMLLAPSDDEGAKDVFLKVFGGPAGPSPESIMPKLMDMPILALWGDADPWTPVDKGMHPGSEFGQYAQNFTLMMIPGAGHCPHDECPDQVNSKMIAWLKTI